MMAVLIKYIARSLNTLGRSGLLETVTDAVEGLDHVEGVVDGFELLSQPLNVAVHGSRVDIDLVVVGRIHESVAALDHPGPGRQCLQDQKLSDRKGHRFGLPCTEVPFWIHPQL